MMLQQRPLSDLPDVISSEKSGLEWKTLSCCQQDCLSVHMSWGWIGGGRLMESILSWNPGTLGMPFMALLESWVFLLWATPQISFGRVTSSPRGNWSEMRCSLGGLSSASQTVACTDIGNLLKSRSRFGRSRMRPEMLHFLQVPRCWSCWPMGPFSSIRLLNASRCWNQNLSIEEPGLASCPCLMLPAKSCLFLVQAFQSRLPPCELPTSLPPNPLYLRQPWFLSDANQKP